MAAYKKIKDEETGKVYAIPASVVDSGEEAILEFIASNPSIEEAQAQSEGYKKGAPKGEDRTAYMGLEKGADIADAVSLAMPLSSWAAKRDMNPVAVSALGGVDAATIAYPPLLAARFAPALAARFAPAAVTAVQAAGRAAPLASRVAVAASKPLAEGAIGAAMYAPQEYAMTGEVGSGTAIMGGAPVSVAALGQGFKQLGRLTKAVGSGGAELAAQALEGSNLPTAAATVRAGTERIKGIQTPSAKVQEVLQSELSPIAEQRLSAADRIGLAREDVPMKSLFGEGPAAQTQTANLADRSQAEWAAQARREARLQKGLESDISDLGGGIATDAIRAGNNAKIGLKEGVDRLIGDLDVSHNKIVKERPDLMISTEGQNALEDALIEVNDLSDMAKQLDIGAGEAGELERLSNKAMESQSYSDLNKLRRFVGRQISKGKFDKDSEYLKSLGRMYAGINDALMLSLDGETAASLQANNKIISSVLKDDALFTSIYNRDIGGEKVLQSITNDSRKIDALRTLLTPEQFDEVVGGYLSLKVKPKKDEKIAAAGVRAMLTNNDPVISTMFKGREKELNDFKELLYLGEDIQGIRATSGAERNPTNWGAAADAISSLADIATRDAPQMAAKRTAESQLAEQAIAKIDDTLRTTQDLGLRKRLEKEKMRLGKLIIDRTGKSALYRPTVTIFDLARGIRGEDE